MSETFEQALRRLADVRKAQRYRANAGSMWGPGSVGFTVTDSVTGDVVARLNTYREALAEADRLNAGGEVAT